MTFFYTQSLNGELFKYTARHDLWSITQITAQKNEVSLKILWVNVTKSAISCNWAQTQNHLVLKQTLNHLAKLAKWLSCVLSIYLYGAFDCMFLSCHVRISEWIHTIFAWMSRNPKQARNLKVKWLQLELEPRTT